MGQHPRFEVHLLLAGPGKHGFRRNFANSSDFCADGGVFVRVSTCLDATINSSSLANLDQQQYKESTPYLDGYIMVLPHRLRILQILISYLRMKTTGSNAIPVCLYSPKS